jgi:outer membrane protein with beta-barrel domain
MFVRTLCVAILFSAVSTPASAQETPAPAPSSGARPARIGIEYGIRFGPSVTSLTSVEPFDPTVVAAAPEPTLNFGGFVTLDVPGPLSLQPEVLFAARGHRVYPRGAPPVVTGSGVKPPQADRVILIRYLEFPMLLRASRRKSDRTSLYLVAGPSFGLRRNAVIREVLDSGLHEEISDEVISSTMSLIAGAGVQHGLWLLDVRLTRGMSNIAVTPQPSPVKANAFSVLMGVRF